MAQWKYTIESGKALREAIEDGDLEATLKCLMNCFHELLDKLDDEDLEDYELDLGGILYELANYDSDDDDDMETIDEYLAEFYDICDDVRAWILI